MLTLVCASKEFNLKVLQQILFEKSLRQTVKLLIWVPILSSSAMFSTFQLLCFHILACMIYKSSVQIWSMWRKSVKKNQIFHSRNTIFIRSTECFIFWCFQRLSNGSIDPDSDINRVIELQETVEKQNSELTNTRTKMLDMNNKYTEIEENFTTAQKDLIKAQEQVVKLQRDLREVSQCSRSKKRSELSRGLPEKSILSHLPLFLI